MRRRTSASFCRRFNLGDSSTAERRLAPIRLARSEAMLPLVLAPSSRGATCKLSCLRPAASILFEQPLSAPSRLTGYCFVRSNEASSKPFQLGFSQFALLEVRP